MYLISTDFSPKWKFARQTDLRYVRREISPRNCEKLVHNYFRWLCLNAYYTDLFKDGVWKFSCIVPIYLRHKYFASRSTKSPAAHNLLSRVLINWWSLQNTDGSLETLSIFWQANFVPAIFHRRVICKPSFHILCARWNPPISKQCSLWSAWKNPENILRFNLHNKVNYTI